jgi:hypothetical protein
VKGPITGATSDALSIDRYDLAAEQSAAVMKRRIQGMDGEYRRWLSANPDAPLAQKMAKIDEVDAKWGYPIRDAP